MITHTPKDLAIHFTNQRKKLKLSQKEVGDLVGLKQKTISAFENNPEATKLDTAFRILSAVNLDLKLMSKNDEADTTKSWHEEW